MTGPVTAPPRLGFVSWRETPGEAQAISPFFTPLGESGKLDRGFLLLSRIRSGAVTIAELHSLGLSQVIADGPDGPALARYPFLRCRGSDCDDCRVWEAANSAASEPLDYVRSGAPRLSRSDSDGRAPTIEAEFRVAEVSRG
jgi:hypothetical protein